LQSRREEIKELDAEILAISVDTPEESQGLAEAAGLEFSLLSDRAARVVEAYGLRHAGGSIEGGDIARPAVFVIDREGNISWRSLTENWRVRVRPESIVGELRKLP
jgi:peroxiredoxin